MNTILLIRLYIPNLVLTVYLKFNMKKYASKFGENHMELPSKISQMYYI